MDGDIVFDFEKDLVDHGRQEKAVPDLPTGDIGQQPRNFVRNYRKTVCAFWVKGMCMKGDQCGFLHKLDADKMPPCHTMLKKGKCTDPDCKFKHTFEDIKECNMYALGFCIFGPDCRYKHTRRLGPPPDVSLLEAAKPKHFRDVNRVVNSVNDNVAAEEEPSYKRARHQQHMKAILPASAAVPSHAPPPAPRPPAAAPPPLPGRPPVPYTMPGGPGPPPPFRGGHTGGAYGFPRPTPPGGPPPAGPPPPSRPAQGSLPAPFHSAQNSGPPPPSRPAAAPLPAPFSQPYQGNYQTGYG